MGHSDYFNTTVTKQEILKISTWSCVLVVIWGVKWQNSQCGLVFFMYEKKHPAISYINVTLTKNKFRNQKFWTLKIHTFHIMDLIMEILFPQNPCILNFSIIIDWAIYYHYNTTLTQWKKYFFQKIFFSKVVDLQTYQL